MIEAHGVALEVDDPASTTRGAVLTLLSHITLTLAENRIAIIGANGSGKSTLAKVLAGLTPPTRGQVYVEGTDTMGRPKEVRRKVGFIFTDPLAQLVMTTPADDIELSLRASIRSKEERRERARELLAARGLAHLAHRSIYDLSGGERQLISLTTVLAAAPRVVIADEPTTLLDLRHARSLRAAFAELPQQVIVATHDLELAAEMDRVLMIDDGVVVADGTPGEVIPFYRAEMTV